MNKEQYEDWQMQEALQQQRIDAEQNMYAPQMQETMQQQQAVLVSQTNPKRIIKEILLRLRGLEENPDGTTKVIGRSKMNEIGIKDVWFILDSHINDNARFSHLNDTQIANLMDAIQEDLVDKLSLNWKVYGIKDKTDLDSINNSVLYNVFMVLNRAREQNEKNWVKGITVESISGGSKLPQVKKDGFWSKFRL